MHIEENNVENPTGGLEELKRMDENLEEIVLPKGITELEKEAFFHCKKLKRVVLPEGITVLPRGLFYGCDSLESVWVPKTVREISAHAFPQEHHDYRGILVEKSVFKEIIIDPENDYFTTVDGVLYSKDMKQLIYCPPNTDKSTISVPDGVETIGKSAFEANTKITGIILPESVRVIEEYAFYKCSNLEEINLSEVKYIGTWAFCECSKLSSVELSKELKVLEKGIFEDCGLTEITIPEEVKYIKSGAFSGCHLNKAVIPKSVEIVEHEAFSGCRDITIYDTIDPNGKDCYFKIDRVNGYPNSEIGFIGIGEAYALWKCAANHKWLDHVITVKSAETDEILYKVLMEADPSQRQYYCILTSGWGHNGTFAFREVDSFFEKIKGISKVKLALSRLQYKADLAEFFEKKYIAYIAKNGKAAVKMCVDEEDYELLQICIDCGALKKGNINELITYSSERNAVGMTAILLDYKQNHIKAK